MSISGPSSVSETAGTATYTVTCGSADPGGGLPGVPGVPGVPGLPGLPLPRLLVDVPNTGALTFGAADGPAPPATAAADYGAPSQSLLTCSTATPSFTIQVPITNDTIDELDEKFTVSATGALVPEGSVSKSVTTTIVDDDPIARITAVAFVVEGDSGTTAVELAVTLASAAVRTTTIAFETDDLTAVAGSDYTAASGNVVLQPGQLTKTISLLVVGDTKPEGPEGFFVNLTSTDNGSLLSTARQGGIGIFDNDAGPIPTLSVPKKVTVEEGDAGTGNNVLFDLRLAAPATERTEVKWKTANFTANKADYEAASGKVVFQKGQRSKTVSIDVKGDKRDEPDEAFALTLSDAVGAVLGSKGAFGIIADDDGPKVKIGKPRVRGKRLVTKLSCPDSASECKGRLVGKAGDLKLGRKRFDLAKGTSKKLKLKMSKAARRELAKHALRAKLKATVSDASGDKRVVTRKARLKKR